MLTFLRFFKPRRVSLRAMTRTTAHLAGDDSATAFIFEALRERYPCRWLPWGASAQLAREFGVSRQMVHAVMREFGWIVTRERPQGRYQCVCGRIQASADLCDECRYVTLPCEQCGQPVRRLASLLARRLRSRESRGRVFCNQGCFMPWMWNRSVAERASRRAELLASVDAALLAVAKDGALPYGAVSRVSRAAECSTYFTETRADALGLRRLQAGQRSGT